MKGTRYRTPADVLRRAQEAVGIPLKNIDRSGRLATGKGAVGTVIEEGWFGYRPNPDSEPDFPEAGVELKVTPYLHTDKGIRAKERLVCDLINYMTEHEKTFETSDFWHKCSTLLLMSYEHRPDVPKGEFTIDRAVLFRFPEEDRAIIQRDWETIMGKVRRGEAHLLSEGDTLYLAACTKGKNASSTRAQPFSPVPAKQRAYSLKPSYMTRVLNSYIFGDEPCEQIVKDWRLLEERSFEDYIYEELRPWFGWRRKDLKHHFGVKGHPKHLSKILLGRMLGIQGKIARTEEFQKASIVPKTIRVRRDGFIEQSMSLPPFDFIELSQETWEESTLRNFLAPARFLFVIFRQDASGHFIFDRIQFWNIPEDDLEEVHRVWERTVRTIRDGVHLIPTANGVYNVLPKRSESSVAHVRPHASRSYYILDPSRPWETLGSGTLADAAQLPDGRWMTKQSFWLNNTYIQKQIAGPAEGRRFDR